MEEDCKEQLRLKLSTNSEAFCYLLSAPRLLRAAHYQLESDKTDKFTAKSLDLECASLELTSRSLSRYMDATVRLCCALFLTANVLLNYVGEEP